MRSPEEQLAELEAESRRLRRSADRAVIINAIAVVVALVAFGLAVANIIIKAYCGGAGGAP